MKRFSLILILTATSIVLSSFAIALEPTIGRFSQKHAQPSDQSQLVHSVMVSDRALSLQNAATTNSYPVTMTLPDHPGKQFAKLSFSFNPPGQSHEVALIDFDLQQTQAFVGTPGAFKQAIAIKTAWIDETGTLWVEFAAAIVPKTTLTILFKPRQASPGLSYEYAIAAYPEAQYAVPVFVGDGSFKL